MGRAGHASCARSMLGANATPSDNASPARCFIAFSFCLGNRQKQVSCRLLEVLGSHGRQPYAQYQNQALATTPRALGRAGAARNGAVSAFPPPCDHPPKTRRACKPAGRNTGSAVDFSLITPWWRYLFSCCRYAFACAISGLVPPSASSTSFV